MEGFLSKQLKEGEITWYMELLDNGKRVATWILGGHEGREEPDRNRQLLSHLNINVAPNIG
jgi:hypothetical protein